MALGYEYRGYWIEQVDASAPDGPAIVWERGTNEWSDPNPPKFATYQRAMEWIDAAHGA